jgi:hypothetical protein
MIESKCLAVSGQSKGRSATAIYEKLVTWFHEKGLIYSSIAKWLVRVHFSGDILEPVIHPGKPSHHLIGFKILTGLPEFPFHTMPAHATTLKISRSTTWDHLRKGSFVVKYLRWVSNTLDSATERTRVTIGKSLLKNLRQARRHG